MTSVPGESNESNPDSPKEQLEEIHNFYKESGRPLPFPYLSPGSYQALERLSDKFYLQRKDYSRWEPTVLAQQIVSLDSSIRIDQLPSEEVLKSYTDELKQALEFFQSCLDRKQDLELLKRGRKRVKPALRNELDELCSLKEKLDKAQKEIEGILQELETSELIIGLDEWDMVAIQEDLTPAIDKELSRRDQASSMKHKKMRDFSLEPIYDDKLYRINTLDQSLATLPDESEDYSRLQDERTSLIRQLNEAIHTQHSRLICQWLELNRNTQISTSETELMASGVDSQYKPIQDNSARLAKELVRQLADLERLSIYVNNLESKHSQETEDTKATKYGLSQKTTKTITTISEKNPDCDPYEVSRLALVLDEQENDNIHGLEDYKDRYHQVVAEALNQVRSLMVKVFLSLQQLEANIRDLNTKII